MTRQGMSTLPSACGNSARRDSARSIGTRAFDLKLDPFGVVSVVLARRGVREARNVDGGAAVVTRAQKSHSEDQRSIDVVFVRLADSSRTSRHVRDVP